jgi:hypothetical protein
MVYIESMCLRHGHESKNIVNEYEHGAWSMKQEQHEQTTLSKWGITSHDSWQRLLGDHVPWYF